MTWKCVRSTGSCRGSLGSHRPTILWVVGRWGVGGILRGLGLLGRITIELTSRGTILAPLFTSVSYLPLDQASERRTLHFNGLPLTLYPDNWQMAMAAFSWLSILTKANPLSAWNLVSTTYPKFWNSGTRSFWVV